MPRTRAVDGSGLPDQRAGLLVLIGLLICLPHLWALVAPQPRTTAAPPVLLWLDGPAPKAAAGLYRLDNPGWGWPQVMAALGLPGPAPATDLALEPTRGAPPAYRLTAAGQPEPVALPAALAPIFFQPIPINQADLDTLMTIPGIGRRLAADIVDYRERHGRIASHAELGRIKGIGPKKAALIEQHVRFD